MLARRYPDHAVIDYLTSSLVTLIVVADPILLSAVFLALTHGMSERQRREVAVRGPLIAFCILVGVGLVGARLLELLGISLSAFRIAGGLLLLWSAWEMVFDRRGQRLEATADTAMSVDRRQGRRGLPAGHPAHRGARRHHRDHPAGRACGGTRGRTLRGCSP